MKLHKSIPCFILLLLSFSGCTVLENLDELTTLGQYSREKDAQHVLVKSIDDHYDALAKGIDQGTMGHYENEGSFVKAFGDPLVKKDLADGRQRWLYRHAIYRLSKDKVYVYFDKNGQVIKWEKLPCPKFF